MNDHAEHCLVEGFEHLEPDIQLPDRNDRHVVAAAIQGRAEIIVTFNLQDFPKKSLSPWGLVAQHPDDFLTTLIDETPDQVAKAAQQCRLRLRNPPISADDYLNILSRQGLPKCTDFLRKIGE